MVNKQTLHNSLLTSVSEAGRISKVLPATKASLKLLLGFMITSISLCSANLVSAETESNNTPETANVLTINTTTTGSVGSGDEDYFMVTNSTNSNFIQLDFDFNGSGPDTLRMKVYGPNSSVDQLSNQTTGTGSIETRYKAFYTITNAVAGATYYVSITKQSADGTKNYNLSATGSNAVISPRSKTAVKAGESYSISVTSSSSWSVSDVPSWVTVSPMSGSGNGSLNVTVQANPAGAVERVADLIIGGATHALTQEENLIVEVESNNSAAEASYLPMNVTATGSVANPDDDYYFITNNQNPDYIQIDLSFSGSGSDTLRLNVYGPNSSITELANITTGTGSVETRYKATYTIATPIAGASYYIRIREGSADGTKTYRLSISTPEEVVNSLIINPVSKSVSKAGENYTINVTTQDSWSVLDIPSWVNLSPTSWTGNATINVSVSPNAIGNDERSASVKIGTATHMITQDANSVPPMTVTLAINTTTNGSVGSSEEDFFMVTNSTNSNFIQLDFEFDGSGPDTLRMKVFGPNSFTDELSNQTTGTGSVETRYKTAYTITNAVAGATYFVYITKQSADGTKNYTLSATGSNAVISPRSKTAVKAGESYAISVTSSTTWSVGEVPSWVTVSPMSGSGNGSLNVTVQANPEGALERVTSLVIGGAIHALTQTENPIVEVESNNSAETATTLPLNVTATGSVANPDEDYFVITNNQNTDSILIDLSFSGSGPDTLRLNVYGPDSSITELANMTTGTGSVGTRYKATYTIVSPPAGSNYYIRIREGSADGTKTYRLSVSKKSGQYAANEWRFIQPLGWGYGLNESWVLSTYLESVYMDAYPWMYSQKIGWLRYQSGNSEQGIWFYHISLGWIYSLSSWGGWYIHEPFSNDDWKQFSQPLL